MSFHIHQVNGQSFCPVGLNSARHNESGNNLAKPEPHYIQGRQEPNLAFWDCVPGCLKFYALTCRKLARASDPKEVSLWDPPTVSCFLATCQSGGCEWKTDQPHGIGRPITRHVTTLPPRCLS